MCNISRINPIVMFLYFVGILLLTMLFMHPILLIISSFSALIFYLAIEELKKVAKSVLFMAPFLLAIIIINPLFSKSGQTPLFYVNSLLITKESVINGCNMSLMLFSIIFWFKCFNIVFANDKIIYIFGKFLPKIALILSMVFRLVPKFNRQFHLIKNSQIAMGLQPQGNWVNKFKFDVRILSILVTWGLENSLDMANSMVARGYALKGRTSYSLYKSHLFDYYILGFLFALITIILVNGNVLNYIFYPSLSPIRSDLTAILTYITLIILMVAPTIYIILGEIKWHYLQSKI